MPPNAHTFTYKEINEAEHLFADAIKRYFGEVWRIRKSAEYEGVSWDCRSPIAIEAGLWRLCQMAIHKGALRAAGKIESREAGEILRFIIFYKPKEREESKLI